MNIYLDIETLPTVDPSVIADFKQSADKEKEEIKAPSNYKDETKIASYISEKAAEIDAGIANKIARTSFDGMYGRIACICYAIDDGEVQSIADDDEYAMLEKFYSDVMYLTAIETH